MIGNEKEREMSRVGMEEENARSAPLVESQESEDQQASLQWSFQSSLAFWTSLFFIEGSVLFTVGSLAMYPVMNLSGWKAEAWVDYSFMIGAWCFNVGNYLCYLQIVNKDVLHEEATQAPRRKSLLSMLTWGSAVTAAVPGAPSDLDERHRFRWLALPEREHSSFAVLFNLCGALNFTLNTMAFLGVDRTANGAFNGWYVATGSIGSLCFATGAIFEGLENNCWNLRVIYRLHELPVLMSIMNFFAALFFFIAYIIDMDRYTDNLCEDGDCVLFVWGTCTTFLLGSLFFTITSWLSLWMWKKQQFGLSYSKQITGRSKKEVDWKQQLMIVVYAAAISIVWVRCGFQLATPFSLAVFGGPAFGFDAILKLLTLHCIMFLLSVLHTTPKIHPYDYLLWMMRGIAVYGLVCEIIIIIDINNYVHAEE